MFSIWVYFTGPSRGMSSGRDSTLEKFQPWLKDFAPHALSVAGARLPVLAADRDRADLRVAL